MTRSAGDCCSAEDGGGGRRLTGDHWLGRRAAGGGGGGGGAGAGDAGTAVSSGSVFHSSCWSGRPCALACAAPAPVDQNTAQVRSQIGEVKDDSERNYVRSVRFRSDQVNPAQSAKAQPRGKSSQASKFSAAQQAHKIESVLRRSTLKPHQSRGDATPSFIRTPTYDIARVFSDRFPKNLSYPSFWQFDTFPSKNSVPLTCDLLRHFQCHVKRNMRYMTHFCL